MSLPPVGFNPVINWAAVDPSTGCAAGEDGRHVVPAASTIKLFVYSAFRRSELDPKETASGPTTGAIEMPAIPAIAESGLQVRATVAAPTDLA